MQYMNFDSSVKTRGYITWTRFLQEENFFTSTTASKPVSGVHLPGTLFSVVKRPECEAIQSLLLEPSLKTLDWYLHSPTRLDRIVSH